MELITAEACLSSSYESEDEVPREWNHDTSYFDKLNTNFESTLKSRLSNEREIDFFYEILSKNIIDRLVEDTNPID